MWLFIYRNKKGFLILTSCLCLLYNVVPSTNTNTQRNIKELSEARDVRPLDERLIGSALKDVGGSNADMRKGEPNSKDESVPKIRVSENPQEQIPANNQSRLEDPYGLLTATPAWGSITHTTEKPTPGEPVPRGVTVKADDNGTEQTISLNVGFVERRKRWAYSKVFAKPPSPRVCQCGGKLGGVNVTLETDLFRLNQYDILIFVQDTGQLPLNPNMWRRLLSSAKVDQRRVYASVEGISKVRFLIPPPHYKNRAFHWSFTYHSKSDLVAPYGSYRPFEKPHSFAEKRNWTDGKTKLVAWMSSSNKTTWKRFDWVKSLQDHVGIGMFGKQFESCSRNSKWCERMIKKYKFYLALEGSCCSEYMTEKLWRSFSWGLIPIVVGATKEDYERFAPPNSFIYADDFGSPQELAEYLHKLDHNDDLYNDYFEWRSKGEVVLHATERGPWIAKTNKPPADNFYSCNRVCLVADKYSNEELNKSSSSSETFFDPDARWWGGSCRACGSHDWIRQFSGLK
ncbi:putative glycoprotein 3-alpha-L-fucosyltransferase A-like [Apostichopus japonicus]|uniref:Fucosyltransferase n=1 Tax=Stichopus japonicus TaxID=307972 RepID=A0A2G8LAA1_STIJA|nr:putative glycoprotein 3-alpha-L-fucosyltransferase A-like [Apostichopus japonicus]